MSTLTCNSIGRASDHDPSVRFLVVIVRASLIGVGPTAILLGLAGRESALNVPGDECARQDGAMARRLARSK
jgi:hypothetical protein